MDTSYAELHCLTNFTFLRGASHAEELVERAAALGYAALAITDECSLAGVVRAHVAAKAHGLKLIVGSELRLEDGTKLVLLAATRNGYGNLSALISKGRRRSAKGEYALGFGDLIGSVDDCLLLWVPKYQVRGARDEGREEEIETAQWLNHNFPGRTWIAVELHRGPADAAHAAALERLSAACGLPLAAAGDVHMHQRGRRALQDTLTAIRLGTSVDQAGYALYPNGERHLRKPDDLAQLYRAEWLAQTLRIAERCTFSLDELRYEYPDDTVPPGEEPAACLRRLSYEGMHTRWPDGAPQKVRDLVEHELAIIAELRYEPYFLTVHDIVRFARSRAILCQGRGSAANSAVCYCLGITSVDPSRMETLFERFVSKERDEPPDIDVDFEHERREEVIQYIYQRYGRARAALTATVISYRRRSALRDVGKALGFTLDMLERLSSTTAWWDKELAPQRLREAGFDPANPELRRLLILAEDLRGFPRHLSQHVGGFVISRGPLSRLVPIENATMPAGPAGALGHDSDNASDITDDGATDRVPDPRPAFATSLRPRESARTVIQWDKDDLDAMGLLKVDVLGLGMLSAIRRSFELIERHRGRRMGLADVPPELPEVYRMIQRADTVGVFQIESRAQMTMLPRLRPKEFYDLVIEVAIVRPGPIQGDMVHPYLRRRQGQEKITYPSDAVKDVLKRTLGIPIFQEQVIKLAMVAAGFSAGEADGLRRAMAAWKRKGGLEPFERKLIDGMRERGYDEQFARQIFAQIQGFGEYGFPESHACSFALLVYVSAWLKCFEPAAFTCALLNSQPMGFYAPSQLVQDARRHGVEVRPVDVMHSGWECTLEAIDHSCKKKPEDEGTEIKSPHPSPLPGGEGIKAELALRLGLGMVKGLSYGVAERIVAVREEQPFADVPDLIRRACLNQRDTEALAAADALKSLAGHRRAARWQALGTEPAMPLFPQPTFTEQLPLLEAPGEAEAIVADYASVGLTLGRHPLALLRPRLRNSVPAARLAAIAGGAHVACTGLVISRQCPGKGNAVFITLEDETGVVNVIVWQRLVERFRKEVLQGRLLRVRGKLQREGEVIHLVAQRLEALDALLGELETRSRDFH